MNATRPFAYAVTIICMIILVGCDSGTQTDQTNLDADTHFKDRYEAAMAISDIDQRDGALTKLALSAAQAGQLEIVKNAFSNIRAKSTEDEARHESAMAFGRSTNFPDAFTIAENIKQIETRDTTMAELAKLAGDAGDITMINRLLGKISAIETHDSAANKSAIALAQKGDIKMAKTIADKIRNKQVQNDTLSQISSGH
jgi:hypothetical protein